jgi:hypothetical protein
MTIRNGTQDWRRFGREESAPNDLAYIHFDRCPLVATAVLDVILILRLAQGLEPDVNAMLHWYQHGKIFELGSLTAEQLVNEGRAREVVRFLRAMQARSTH